jgi:hypothetical protein
MFILKKMLWSPDGCRLEVVEAGSYQDGELPDRFLVIAGLGVIDTVEGGEKNLMLISSQSSQMEQPEGAASSAEIKNNPLLAGFLYGAKHVSNCSRTPASVSN